MSELTFVRQISILSLFFSIVNFAAAVTYEPKASYGTFILVLLVVYVNEAMKLKGSLWPKFLLAALCIPFFWAGNLNDVIYYLVIGFYASYISLKPARIITYINCTEIFKRGAFITVAMLVLAMAFSNIAVIEEVTIPYSIVYFVSSVVFLRTLRYTEYNRNDKRINEINIKYSALITLAAFLAGIKFIRETTLTVLDTIYQFIASIFMKLFYWVLIGIAYIVQLIIDLIKSIYENKLTEQGEAAEKESIGNSDALSKDFADNIISFFNENQVAAIILRILVFSIILYIVIRLIKTKKRTESFQEDYKESKEKVDINGRGSEGYARKFSELLKPKSPAEYIRFYYRKYLILSIKKDIDITKKDTTLEIQQKTERLFNRNVLDKMRDSYIKVRYGGQTVDKKDSKEFRKYYDEIEG